LSLLAVERFFRDLTQNRLRRGILRDVEELILAIGDYSDQHNDNPKPAGSFRLAQVSTEYHRGVGRGRVSGKRLGWPPHFDW